MVNQLTSRFRLIRLSPDALTVVSAPAALTQRWLIAVINVRHADVDCKLAEPHYIEKDPRRTPGGVEDHWVFDFENSLRIAFVFLRSYNQLRVVCDRNEPEKVRSILTVLGFRHDIEWSKPPLQLQ